MAYYLRTLISFSILLPALIGIVRYQKAKGSFLPFLLFIWAGLLSESVSFILMQGGQSNVISFNLYTLAEALCILWQFRVWKIFRSFNLFLLTLAILIAFWIFENFILSSINKFNSYFIVSYSFFIVLLSITCLNKLLLNLESGIIKNSKFAICIAFILYFTYSVLVEAFWLYGLNESAAFRIRIYGIHGIVNLLTNLTYALAILWIRARQKFTLQY